MAPWLLSEASRPCTEATVKSGEEEKADNPEWEQLVVPCFSVYLYPWWRLAGRVGLGFQGGSGRPAG